MNDKIKRYLEYIFPRTCINCWKIWEYLCKECKKQLVVHEELCPICHKHSERYKICTKCKNDRIKYEGIIIGFKYSGLIKKLILKLKYYHLSDIGEFLAQRLKTLLSTTSLLDEKLLITSVPSHWTRKYFIKGYNQSEILAKNLSCIIHKEYIRLCKKNKFTFSQTKLNREKRLINLNNSFELSWKLEWDETILIIDDITTTWSTINEIAKTIKKSYPETKVWWLVIGRH